MTRVLFQRYRKANIEITEKKAELRKEFLQRRRAIQPADKSRWDEAIYQRLIRFPPLVKAEVVMTYLSLKAEVDTLKLVSYLFQKGKHVVVPRTEIQSRRIIPTEIKNLETDLAVGNFKILEPLPGRSFPVPAEEIDLCIVPGIAFDLQGHRIGYGHGYYDGLLALLQSKSINIGLTYECQLTRQLPVNAWDMRVSYVATEKRILKCK